VRQAHLVDIDTESEPKEALLKVDELQPLGSRVSLMSEEFEASEPLVTRTISSTEAATLSPSSFHKRYRSSYMIPSPSSSLTLPIRKRYWGTSELILDTKTKDESLNFDAKGEGSEDEGPGLDYEGYSLEDEGLGLEEEEEATPEGQWKVVLLVDTAMDEPLGLRYEALRHRELALGEGSVPSTFEVGQSSSFTIILSSSVIHNFANDYPSSQYIGRDDQFLEIGAQLELYRSIIHDHMQRLNALPYSLFKGYVMDLTELYTRSGVVRDEIFSKRYRFRSLEREQERAMVTFNAIWSPVLALEAWAGQTDAQRAALRHAIYDIQRANHDLRR
nr:hypothetical protein [Tanacetum cinerariifolium]